MPYRKPRLPRARWDDQLHDYCGGYLGLQHLTDIGRFSNYELADYEKTFVKYCMSGNKLGLNIVMRNMIRKNGAALQGEGRRIPTFDFPIHWCGGV